MDQNQIRMRIIAMRCPHTHPFRFQTSLRYINARQLSPRCNEIQCYVSAMILHYLSDKLKCHDKDRTTQNTCTVAYSRWLRSMLSESLRGRVIRFDLYKLLLIDQSVLQGWTFQYVIQHRVNASILTCRGCGM